MKLGYHGRGLTSTGVMEDAMGYLIQETGQEQRLARMVSLYRLDSALTSMDAGGLLVDFRLWVRGEG